MNKLIIAPTYVKKISAPLIFLAGPIQGTDRWQDKAVEFILSKRKNVYIANPRRSLEFSRSLKKGDFTQEMYNEQVDWETYHLRKAGENGVVMFWLANETNHFCNRAYAQTSRFELGEWKTRHEYSGANLVVGIDDSFTNARYLRRRLGQDCPNVPVCSTLEETCNETLNKIKKV